MTRLPPDSDSLDGRVGQPVSGDALQRLGQAIANLAGDSNFIIDSLTELAIAMRPVSKNRLTKQQERFLIESGTFTAETLAATQREVDRGGLQLVQPRPSCRTYAPPWGRKTSPASSAGTKKPFRPPSPRVASTPLRSLAGSAFRSGNSVSDPRGSYSRAWPRSSRSSPRDGAGPALPGSWLRYSRALSPRGARHPSSGYATAATSAR